MQNLFGQIINTACLASFPSAKAHTSLSEGVSCKLTLCSAAARCFESPPFHHRLTAHVWSREQSIHHLTSLRHDDTAGRHKGIYHFSNLSGLSGYILKYIFLKKQKKKGKELTSLFQKVQSQDCHCVISETIWFRGIINHKLNNIIYSISNVSLSCNLLQRCHFSG